MKIRVLNAEPLYDYREANKITQGIDLDGVNAMPPKDMVEFWVKQIIANHSTLRCIKFRIIDERPKSVVMQLIRATKGHPQPEVQSSRPDWNNGKERSSDPYETILFMQDHTAESFIEMAKQRLCNRTEKRTLSAMTEIVRELRRSKNPFLKAVGICARPQCEWYGGCTEIKSCGKYKKVSDYILKEYKNEQESKGYE